MKTFLDSNRTKKAYLLTAWATNNMSIVDNIATKDLLRYEKVKDKLLSLHDSGELLNLYERKENSGNGKGGNAGNGSNGGKVEKAMVVSEKKEGHKMKKPTPVKYFYCQNVGHKITECRNRLMTEKDKEKTITCDYCHKQGHKTSDCRKKATVAKAKENKSQALVTSASQREVYDIPLNKQ